MYDGENGHESLVQYKPEVSEWREFQMGSTQESFGQRQ